MSFTSSKIVVVGAGFAGLWSALSAARRLDVAGKNDGSVKIIIIAPEPTLYIRPRLYENDISEASVPLAELLEAVGVEYIQGTVQRILVEKDELEYTSSDGRNSTISYNRLVLASGSHLFRPLAVTGIDEYTFNADQMADAVVLDKHIKSLAALPD